MYRVWGVRFRVKAGYTHLYIRFNKLSDLKPQVSVPMNVQVQPEGSNDPQVGVIRV